MWHSSQQGVKLSNIAGHLERRFLLRKTETRLPRDINNLDLTEFIGKKPTQEDKWWIKDETVRAVGNPFVS